MFIQYDDPKTGVAVYMSLDVSSFGAGSNDGRGWNVSWAAGVGYGSLQITSKDCTVSIDGQETKFTSPSIYDYNNAWSTTQCGSGVTTIWTADGAAKRIYVSFIFYIKATVSGTYRTWISVDGYLDLPAIGGYVPPPAPQDPPHQPYPGDISSVSIDAINAGTYYKVADPKDVAVTWTNGSNTGRVTATITSGTKTKTIDSVSSGVKLSTLLEGLTLEINDKFILTLQPSNWDTNYGVWLWGNSNTQTKPIIIMGMYYGGKRISKVVYKPTGGVNTDFTQLAYESNVIQEV